MTTPDNPLTQVRGQLAALLGEGDLRAYSAYPGGGGDLTYPLVYVVGDLPYLTTTGAAYGGAFVHCNVTIVTENGDQAAQAAQLDDQILKVLAVLRAAPDWDLDTERGVDQPVRVLIDDTAHLAVLVHCLTEIQL